MRKFILLVFILTLCNSIQTIAQNKDWANLEKYEKANKLVMRESPSCRKVVFMGNSITEAWVRIDSLFFKRNGYVGRGISGQTSFQFLLRFRQDVINLSPQIVVINAGTNDVAENTGKYNEDYTMGNIISMVELARASKLKIILTSVLPAASFWWNKSILDSSEKIERLNNRIKKYAFVHKIPYVDYYSSMVVKSDGSLNKKYSNDGVHPTMEGYKVMEQLVDNVINSTFMNLRK